VYSPLTYLPQVLGILFAKITYHSAAVLEYSARIFGLMAFILLTFIAIKLAPIGKWTITFLGLMPMTVQQASTMSGDIVSIGITFIWIALLLNLYIKKQILKYTHIISLVLIAVILPLTKITNIVLLIPLLFLPVTLFGSNKRKFVITGLSIILSVVCTIFWLLALRYYGNSVSVHPDSSINPAGQIQFLLNQPQRFLLAFWNTFIGINPRNVYTDFGSQNLIAESFYGYFSWLTYKLPIISIFLGYATLAVTLLYKDTESIKINNNLMRKIVYIYTSTFIASIIAISGALYISWTQVGANIISGIQGRYFIGLVPLLIPLFLSLQKYFSVILDSRIRIGQLVCVVSVVNLTIMLLLTISWFYR